MRNFFLIYYLIFSCVITNGQNINTNCLNFDDNLLNYVRFHSPVALQPIGSFTIEFWMRAGELGATGGYNQWWEGDGLVDSDTPGGFFLSPGNDFGISLFGNKIAFGVGSSGYSDVTIFSNSTIVVGQWLHVAATYNSTSKEMKLYINGVLQQSVGTSITGGNKGDCGTISLGRIDHTQSGSYYNGDIDEVRIWSVVRTQTEISNFKDKQINGATSGLVISYHFNQGNAGQNNSGITTLTNDSGIAAPTSFSYDGGIYNFLLNGSTSNFVSAGLTLPVTWQSFTAEKQGTGALLKWSTASEQNTKDFEVQHSTNTLSWTPLGSVMAAGNSTTVRHYSFMHNTPFKGGLYNYYRILQRDLDGKFSFSKIASLSYGEPGADVIVYPNPAKEFVTIYLAESNEVKLVNVAGATVWRGTLTAGRNDIPLSHLTRGVYWVVTENYKKQLLIQ